MQSDNSSNEQIEQKQQIKQHQINVLEWTSQQTQKQIDRANFNDSSIFTLAYAATIYAREPLKGRFLFSVKFSNGYLNSDIGISDADSEAQLSQSYGNNSFIYEGQFGVLKSGNQCLLKADKINNYDTVNVSGDLNEGWLKLEINNKTIFIQESQKLSDKSIRWVPTIFLWEDSRVRILGSWVNLDEQLIHLALGLFNWDDDLMYQMISILSSKKQKDNQSE